jgi:hypothetical protein
MTQEQDQLHLEPINGSPVWHRAEGLSVPTAVFCPSADEPLDSYLEASTSGTFLARDFSLVELNQPAEPDSSTG